MQFLSDLLPLLQSFSAQMTEPTFSNLLSIVSGWILSRRHTVSAGLAVDPSLKHHFCSYYRVFSKAVWNTDAVGLELAHLVLGLSQLMRFPRVCLVVDDTLCKKKGRKLFGVGMHYDACATGRGLSNSHSSYKANGHCWVILGLGVQFDFWPGHFFCLPILARLYHNHKSAKHHRLSHQTKVQLAVGMIQRVCQKFEDRSFDLLCDSAYASKNLLGALPKNCHLTARWILNAALYEPVQPFPHTRRRGRPPVHGKRMDGVDKIIKTPATQIQIDVYGKHQKLQVWQTTACFYATPQTLLNIIITRSIDDKNKPHPDSLAVLFSTDTTLSPRQVIELYARRWSIEVTIHDAKQQLGIAQPQVWCKKSVQRAVPTMLMMYSMIVSWFATAGHQSWRPTLLPWYRQKTRPSFSDMLGHLRMQLLNHQMNHIFQDHKEIVVWQKTLTKLAQLIKQAA